MTADEFLVSRFLEMERQNAALKEELNRVRGHYENCENALNIMYKHMEFGAEGVHFFIPNFGQCIVDAKKIADYFGKKLERE